MLHRCTIPARGIREAEPKQTACHVGSLHFFCAHGALEQVGLGASNIPADHQGMLVPRACVPTNAWGCTLHALQADTDVVWSVTSLVSSSCILEPPLSAWQCCPVAEILRLWTRSRDVARSCSCLTAGKVGTLCIQSQPVYQCLRASMRGALPAACESLNAQSSMPAEHW